MPETLETKIAVIASNQDKMASAVEALTKSLNELVVTMTKREVEDRHQQELVKDLNQIVKSHQPVIDAMIKSQKFKDHFYKTISSTWARLIAIIVIVSIGASLGIDTKLLGGK